MFVRDDAVTRFIGHTKCTQSPSELRHTYLQTFFFCCCVFLSVPRLLSSSSFHRKTARALKCTVHNRLCVMCMRICCHRIYTQTNFNYGISILMSFYSCTWHSRRMRVRHVSHFISSIWLGYFPASTIWFGSCVTFRCSDVEYEIFLASSLTHSHTSHMTNVFNMLFEPYFILHRFMFFNS